MGIESIKVSGTSYPISPLIFDVTEEKIIGRIENKNIVSVCYEYLNNVTVTNDEGYWIRAELNGEQDETDMKNYYFTNPLIILTDTTQNIKYIKTPTSVSVQSGGILKIRITGISPTVTNTFTLKVCLLVLRDIQ